MDIEQLAMLMRDKALLEGAGDLEASAKLDKAKITAAKQQRIAKLEEMQKLYFNAGRWAGGARDWNARQAYERVSGKIEEGRMR